MKPSERVATEIGSMLAQEYVFYQGQWWLFTLGKPARALRQDEIDWHTARRHQPFVEEGIPKGHPDWWSDPVQ